MAARRSPNGSPPYPLLPPASESNTAICYLRFSALQSILILLLLGLILLNVLSPQPSSTTPRTSEHSLSIPRQLPELLTGGTATGDSTKRFCTDLPINTTENLKSDGSKHYLAAVIFNRVFEKDLFGITAYECKQWIEYMFYAGVDHIFWYDTAQSDAESQEASLHEYIKAGVLTYHRFHHLLPGNVGKSYHFEQDNSYAHFLHNYDHTAMWVVEIDVDEYPFSSSDTRSCFLQRLMVHYDLNQPNVTQVLLQCMIFAGNPKGDLKDGWVIERYQRRKHQTEGTESGYQSRTKPIFRPHLSRGVTPYDPHMFSMKVGKTVVADSKEIRINHYWGARLSDFGPDTQEVVEMLESDTSIQAIASELKLATGLVNRSLGMASSI